MKSITSMILAAVLLIGPASARESIPNELIDDAGFRQIVAASADERQQRRLTEAEFIEAIESGEYLLLDARSASFFQLRHVRGAVNLPLTEFTAETLAAIIPSPDTKILIYCNNNFLGSPVSFATKAPAAALNLHTQAGLRAYGYTRIHELGPSVDIRTTKIPMAGREVDEGSS